MTHVATIRGPRRMLLLGERTALNILVRASGVATQAHRMASIREASGWRGEVAGTRKVTPGFRLIEKYSLLVGGCSTHRMDLSHMVMLKDNHVWAVGSITNAVKCARRACGFSSKIEVEARTLEEALEAASAGADVVMLDNYSPADLTVDARKLKETYPSVLVEASGGITETNIREFMLPEVDVISMGCLTQGYKCLDFSLKLRHGVVTGGANDAAKVVANKLHDTA
jgi:nicotinate-nucleotide pyrophosphorylase (carboxylating)